MQKNPWTSKEVSDSNTEFISITIALNTLFYFENISYVFYFLYHFFLFFKWAEGFWQSGEFYSTKNQLLVFFKSLYNASENVQRAAW